MAQTHKYMSVEEFRDAGYLQEVNRLFFHPRGLALAVNTDAKSMMLGPILDYRDDPEGCYFGELTAEDVARGQRLQGELDSKVPARIEALGYMIQPLKET